MPKTGFFKGNGRVGPSWSGERPPVKKSDPSALRPAHAAPAPSPLGETSVIKAIRESVQVAATAAKGCRGETIEPIRVRTLFRRIFTLGTRGCQAAMLLDFLRHYDADTVYLVGDIVDGWRLKAGWYWPQTHNDVVQKLLRKVRKGARLSMPGTTTSSCATSARISARH